MKKISIVEEKDLKVICKTKRCHKEINPEEYPGVYNSEPFVYDKNCGCCVDCPFIRE